MGILSNIFRRNKPRKEKRTPPAVEKKLQELQPHIEKHDQEIQKVKRIQTRLHKKVEFIEAQAKVMTRNR